MKTKNIPLLLLMMLFLASCSLPFKAKTETPPPTITQIIIPTATRTPIPSKTPLPSETPPPSATPTPSTPIVSPKDINVNCRYGFGIDWAVVGALLPEHPAALIGRNLTSSWWYVTLDDNLDTKCWVSADVTEIGGSLASIRPVEQSKSFVTKLTLEPTETIIAPGCLAPIQPLEIHGTIEMNGPGTVSWRFESEQSGVVTDHAIEFSESGIKKVADSFTPPVVEGNYWVKLVVIGPNDMEIQGSYKIECP